MLFLPVETQQQLSRWLAHDTTGKAALNSSHPRFVLSPCPFTFFPIAIDPLDS